MTEGLFVALMSLQFNVHLLVKLRDICGRLWGSGCCNMFSTAQKEGWTIAGIPTLPDSDLLHCVVKQLQSLSDYVNISQSTVLCTITKGDPSPQMYSDNAINAVCVVWLYVGPDQVNPNYQLKT